VLDVENWAEIRRLYRAEGLPIRAIARVMGVSRNTVRAAVASDGPPRYVRRRPGSIVDGFEPAIRELLRAFPAVARIRIRTPPNACRDRHGAEGRWDAIAVVLLAWPALPRHVFVDVVAVTCRPVPVPAPTGQGHGIGALKFYDG